MPDHPIVAGPEAEIVQRPGSHRGAIAVSTRNTDLSAFLPVDMTTRRSQVQPIPLARIDPGSFLVETEPFDPTGILVDPRVLHTRGCHPLKGAPDVEQERAIFGGEGGDRDQVRAGNSTNTGRLHAVSVVQA